MKLTVTIKQDTQKVVKLDKVKSHYIDKNYLVITTEDNKRHYYKSSTVLEIEEL